MNIPVNVINQRLKIATNLKSIVSGTQDFIKFEFNLGGDWDGLLVFAQFMQNGVAYNQYLDDENCAFLPAEIGVGTVTLMLYGSHETTIATTNYLTLVVDENILVSDAQSTNISESLYTQLVTKVNTLITWNEQYTSEFRERDSELQAAIDNRAMKTDLANEIVRAKTAEQSLSASIILKANDSRVSELENQVNKLQNNEYVSEKISAAVQEELNRYLASGALANMTIQDHSITRAKVTEDIEVVLQKAEASISEADAKGYAKDYADGRVSLAETEIEKIKAEIADAYTFNATEGNNYNSLKATFNGVLTLAKRYTNNVLDNYKAFDIKFCDSKEELPAPSLGKERTFYLVPNSDRTKYEKFWYVKIAEGEYIRDSFGNSSTVVVTSLPENHDEDIDYILKTNGGYLHYKWIDGNYRVIGGSVAKMLTELPPKSEASEFADYYVLNDSGSYVHYRYVKGQVGSEGVFHEIGGNVYTKDEIDTKVATINARFTAVESRVSSAEQNIEANQNSLLELGNSLGALKNTVDGMNTEGNTYDVKYDSTSGQFQFLETSGGEQMIKQQFTLLGGGGGGGGGAATNMTVEKITKSPLVITKDDKAEVVISFSSTDSYGSDIEGSYRWTSGGKTIMEGALIQGVNTFDLTSYVTVGTTKFTLSITDEGGSATALSYTIQVVDVSIESAFSDRYTNDVGKSVNFTYTPYGAIQKTIHFKLDGVEETRETASSGILQSYTIPPQAHGSHLLEVWATATVNSTEVETAHIFKDIMWYDENETAPVIGCIYRADHHPTVNARQYDTTPIIYNVFDPRTSSPNVILAVDGKVVSNNTMGNSQDTWNYQSGDIGSHVLTITCRDTVVTINIEITELGIDVSPITGGLEIDFNPSGITNASSDRLWSNDTYHMTVSDNFDWSNGGYMIDEDGVSYFCIKAGTRAYFDYKMFDGGINHNPSVAGAEMKIIFKTENVQDANAVWFTNVERISNVIDGITETRETGVQLGVHNGWLRTNNASATDVTEADSDESIAATNTYLYMPYSEEDKIEMDINIEPIGYGEEMKQFSAIYAYEDGVPSKAYVYNTTDILYQITPQDIVIGSDECDVRIYRMKFYSTSLSTENVLKNFISDAPNSTEMLDRYNRNSIYYNSERMEYTPYASEGVLTPESLAHACPNLKVLKLDCPVFTSNKNTFIKHSSLECIHTGGDPYYDNWKFENGYHSGRIACPLLIEI